MYKPQQHINRNNNHSTKSRLQYRFKCIKASAKTRGISFNLTFDEFYQLWQTQHGLCGYTGRRMSHAIGRGYIWRNWTVSIDRLDPTGAYELSNVILCRYDANRLKGRRNFFEVSFMEAYPEFVSRVLTIKPELNMVA